LKNAALGDDHRYPAHFSLLIIHSFGSLNDIRALPLLEFLSGEMQTAESLVRPEEIKGMFKGGF
jgi:hypothetical protein